MDEIEGKLMLVLYPANDTPRNHERGKEIIWTYHIYDKNNGVLKEV